MKRKGFSLAEVLITIGIIGVIAVLAVPGISKAMPDRNKSKIVKYYNLIDKTTQELINNEDIYYRSDIGSATSSDFDDNGLPKTSTKFGCIGLNCDSRPKNTDFNKDEYEGICKYPNLLAETLNLTNLVKCSSSSAGKSVGFSNDGAYWEISAEGNDISKGYKILIDIDSQEKGDNCIYNKSSCKYPDIFMFAVNANGGITAYKDDKLTSVYINNITRIDRNADFDEAYQQ